MKKEVLIIFSSSSIGGAERSLSRMAFSNSDIRINYQLATFGASGDWSNWTYKKKLNPICFSNNLINLIRYLKENRPNFVYICGFRLSFLARFIIFFFKDIKLIEGVRWNPASNSKLDRTFRILEFCTQFLVSGYITNSECTTRTLSKFVRDQSKLKLIYNGIDPKVLPRKKIEQRVLTVANISTRKGHEKYLYAIKKVIKVFPDIKFLFIGKDHLNGKIQKLIIKEGLKENVQILGYRENISRYLSSSLIFALPSLYGEGCPTSLLEAFANRLPVVAYNIDGIPEIVTSGQDGFLCPVGDIEDLAKKIIYLLSNPTDMVKFGEKGHNKVVNLFSLSKMVEEHNKFFLGI